MASSQQKVSHTRNESARACSQTAFHHDTRHPFRQNWRKRVGQDERRMHSKLFCLAAARNYMPAYHKETVYHSINIGPALIVNGVISIQHQAEMKNVGGINIPVRSAHITCSPGLRTPPYTSHERPPSASCSVDPPPPLKNAVPRANSSPCCMQLKPGAMFS